MIVVETLLRDIFSQIPDVVYTDVNRGESSIPVKYEWGGQDDLNLYMVQETGNKTPLIWLVQGNIDNFEEGELNRDVVLIISKNSEHKADRNPKVWDTEFVDFLNPLLEKVIFALKVNGVCRIVDNKFSIRREANYSETEGKNSKTIDHWNIIEFKCKLIFSGINQCVKQNIFNL